MGVGAWWPSLIQPGLRRSSPVEGRCLFGVVLGELVHVVQQGHEPELEPRRTACRVWAPFPDVAAIPRHLDLAASPR